MNILEINKEDYHREIGCSFHKYNSAQFNYLNEQNTEKVYYLLFKDTEYRLGIIAGLNKDSIRSPFSAPFGGFSFKKKNVKLLYLKKALLLLESWAKENGIKNIEITLPPVFYHDTFIAKEINTLFLTNYKIKNVDLNYHFETIFLDESYEQKIWYSAKKSLVKSMKNKIHFKKCSRNEEKKQAYETIKLNRNLRGFPLKMKYEDIEKTDHIIKKDFFLVSLENKIPLASAIIFHISDQIVQVVYWGDNPNYSNLCSMNFISYMIFKYYKEMNIKIVDIGISTENSIPNYGLCEFKESIGCKIVPKLSFIKTFENYIKPS